MSVGTEKVPSGSVVSGVLSSEFRKVTSLRAWWALGIPPILIGFFASALYAGISTTLDVAEAEELDGLVVLIGLFVAIGAAVLFAAVFAAVTTASEFRYSTSTATFLTAPSRTVVVAAKLAVVVVVGTGYGLAAIVTSLISIALFGGGSSAVDGVVRICLLGLVATALWSLVGGGLGLLIGSPTWAAVALVAWVPVGELVVLAVVHGIGAGALAALLPNRASFVMIAGGNIDTLDVMHWAAALSVVTAWAAVLSVGGWWRTRCRDIT